MDRIKLLFFPHEADNILCIPLNPTLPADQVWNFTPNGIYTVKSGYKIKFMHDFTTSQGTSSIKSAKNVGT